MIELDNLYVTQNDLRNHSYVNIMIDFVKNNGFWTEKALRDYANLNKIRISPLIAISKFEDNKLFLHDGHHRVVSTYLAGRNYLRDDEYVVTNWQYKDYIEFVPENNWFTPYDPRTHIRNKELKQYKEIISFIKNKSFEEIAKVVEQNKYMFCSERDIYFLPELAEKIKNFNK